MKTISKMVSISLIILILISSASCRKTYEYEDLKADEEEIVEKLMFGLNEHCKEMPPCISVHIGENEKTGWAIIVELYEFSPQRDLIIEWLEEKFGSKVQIEFKDIYDDILFNTEEGT